MENSSIRGRKREGSSKIDGEGSVLRKKMRSSSKKDHKAQYSNKETSKTLI